MRIRKNDSVIVLVGASKGKTGRVLFVDTAKNTVVVEGLNVRTKHERKTQRNPKGGVIHKEMPIHASNVALYNSSTRKPARVGFKVTGEGENRSRVRVDKRTGEEV